MNILTITTTAAARQSERACRLLCTDSKPSRRLHLNICLSFWGHFSKAGGSLRFSAAGPCQRIKILPLKKVCTGDFSGRHRRALPGESGACGRKARFPWGAARRWVYRKNKTGRLLLRQAPDFLYSVCSFIVFMGVGRRALFPMPAGSLFSVGAQGVPTAGQGGDGDPNGVQPAVAGGVKAAAGDLRGTGCHYADGACAGVVYGVKLKAD